jgi:hypothetical protein
VSTEGQIGFQGVTFRSSVTHGTNYVAFNPLAFSYVEGSADARKVTGLSYVVDKLVAEAARSKAPGVDYWSLDKRKVEVQ